MGNRDRNKTNRETKRRGVKREGRKERERGWAHPIISVFFKKTKKKQAAENSVTSLLQILTFGAR